MKPQIIREGNTIVLAFDGVSDAYLDGYARALETTAESLARLDQKIIESYGVEAEVDSDCGCKNA